MKTDSLTHEENVLINDFRKLSTDARKIISANIKLIIGE